MKAQMLLETCADTRISNAVTQMTTKYNALLSLAKEIMRRLELHYQVVTMHSVFVSQVNKIITTVFIIINVVKK
jgi:nesprin-1